MISVHFVAGDNNGGPHVQVTLADVDCDPDEITDEQVLEGNAAVRQQYREAFGTEPESVIVYIT